MSGSQAGDIGETVALIVAAGSGERAGGGIPKQFRTLAGKSLIAHSVDAFAMHPGIHRTVIVIAGGQEDATREALGDRPCPPLVTGGATRRESVQAGLAYLATIGTPPARVLVHDAARPIVPTQVVDDLLDALTAYEGAIPALPVTDTLVRHEILMGDTVSRDHLYCVQTPQAFLFGALCAAHKSWPAGKDATDDAQMVRGTGHVVIIVPGHIMLEKITHAEDFDRAEALLAAQMSQMPPLIPRTGLGFDVHRLEAGAPLWLCGVKVPHSHGLAGHSDADVALHALVDAILGALAEGDIGSHFPPSDPQWRGASSDRFLAFAIDRVRVRGGILDHMDVTIICEAPKIGPHRQAMRARLAEVAGIPEDRISVKATTTERLGLTGRGEGIAAQAVVSIRLPEIG